MNDFNKNIAATGAVFMALTIAIGAFGAHGLKQLIEGEALATFEVGVRYQAYHSLAIILLSIVPSVSAGMKKTVFWLFIGGIILFSGSIYLLSLNEILSFDAAKIGFVTPLGGLLFILGWAVLAYGLITLKKQ